MMYENGFGCLVDYDEAAKWYTIGDNNDIAAASNNLGLMYLNGKGVPNDGSRALRLFSKAMGKGSWVSAFNIGCMYMDGSGVPRDFASARRFFNIVIEKSNDFNGIVKLAHERIADMDKRNQPLSKLEPVVRLAVFKRTASGTYEQCDTATVIGDEPGLRFYRDSKRTHFLVLSSDKVSTLLGASGAIVSGSMFNTFKIIFLGYLNIPSRSRLAIVIMILMFVIMVARTEEIELTFVGIGLAVLSMLPHELLHAICFKKDVYLYTNLSKGLLFVVGTERMSKARFIILGMLPNIVFGFIPFALYLINPNWTTLGSMGAICIAMGAGDYMNVFNALTQMPKGACCYLHKLNTFWYMPEETNEKTY
jgi:hypothetical protein